MFDAVTWCIIDLLCRKDAVCTSFILYFALQAMLCLFGHTYVLGFEVAGFPCATENS